MGAGSHQHRQCCAGCCSPWVRHVCVPSSGCRHALATPRAGEQVPRVLPVTYERIARIRSCVKQICRASCGIVRSCGRDPEDVRRAGVGVVGWWVPAGTSSRGFGEAGACCGGVRCWSATGGLRSRWGSWESGRGAGFLEPKTSRFRLAIDKGARHNEAAVMKSGVSGPKRAADACIRSSRPHNKYRAVAGESAPPGVGEDRLPRLLHRRRQLLPSTSRRVR